MFSQINELEKVEVSLIDDSANGATSFDSDFN